MVVLIVYVALQMNYYMLYGSMLWNKNVLFIFLKLIYLYLKHSLVITLFSWHVFKDYTISLTFQLGTQMEVMHHSTLRDLWPESQLMKIATAWCLNTRHRWRPKCLFFFLSTRFDSSEGICVTVAFVFTSMSGVWWAVYQQRRNCPSVRARGRWLVEGGKGRDDRTGTRKLSRKTVTFTFLSLHLKKGASDRNEWKVIYTFQLICGIINLFRIHFWSKFNTY